MSRLEEILPRPNEIWRLPPVHWLLLAGGAYALQRWIEPGPLLPDWARWVGYGLITLGAALSLVAAAHLVLKHTNLHAFRDPDKLVTRGVFAYSRNPIYLGLTLALMGVGLYWNTSLSLWPAIIFFLLANFWYAPSEEKAARRVFGAAYDDYRARVRRWI